MCHSGIALRRGIDNSPGPDEIINMKRFALLVYDSLHAFFRLRITSGFRCPTLNSAVGGSKTSAHLDGRAADFKIGAPTLNIGRLLPIARKYTEFDQIIVEFGGVWIHIGIAKTGEQPRGEILESYMVGDEVKYRPWEGAK
jgi:Peptidase M15.